MNKRRQIESDECLCPLTVKQDIKKQRKRISLEEKHENSYGGGEKMRMLGATEVKMSGSEKKKSEQDHICLSSIKKRN